MGLVLLSLYVDFDMENAQKMFNEMCEKDIISLSVIITSYVQNEEAQVGMCKMILSSFFAALPFSCCAFYCYLWDFRICYCLVSIKFCWGYLVFSCFVNFGIVILCV